MLSILYTMRHFIALGTMLLGIYCIKIATAFLYVGHLQNKVTLIDLYQYLWQSNDNVLRLIVLFNFIIKPVFIYCSVLLLFYWLNQKYKFKKG